VKGFVGGIDTCSDGSQSTVDLSWDTEDDDEEVTQTFDKEGQTSDVDVLDDYDDVDE